MKLPTTGRDPEDETESDVNDMYGSDQRYVAVVPVLDHKQIGNEETGRDRHVPVRSTLFESVA
eukprot:CAMPEP_0194300772 /NCGR_PEP_ID=MMETSP0169-20130528/61442_1 /TAXON_ID=218684 /ORGANISM="Corethron pennatum, Strain L29A3" /LENGTH=62 /DNA_ID=CAMNT_0039050977 /DNA_START=1166 /DNA_END=1351 /DNA_ORIENTATION=+